MLTLVCRVVRIAGWRSSSATWQKASSREIIVTLCEVPTQSDPIGTDSTVQPEQRLRSQGSPSDTTRDTLA